MMKSLPIISVITVTYNCCDTIEQTILNVLKQTYLYLEYIVIDGGSTDGTVDVIKKYAHKLAYWVSEPDKGIYDAMNKGTLVATGEWLLFRNSGDFFFSSTTIQDVFQWYIDQGEDFVYGGMRLFVTEAYKDTYYKPQEDDIWRSAWFPHPASEHTIANPLSDRLPRLQRLLFLPEVDAGRGSLPDVRWHHYAVRQ